MSSSIFDDDNVPKGTGKKKEDMDELREIHAKSRPSTHLMNAPILSPVRSAAQHYEEKKAATTAANKKSFTKKTESRKF